MLFFKNKKKQYVKTPEFQKDINKCVNFIERLDKELAGKAFISLRFRNRLIHEYKELFNQLRKNKYTKQNEKVADFLQLYNDLFEIVKGRNIKFIESEINQYSDLFDDIDGKSLDMQQRKAVVIDDINNLVVAGAGSGKTLTISAKVKYLVDSGRANANEILLMSFTKTSADEMEERIANKLGIKINVRTFHKLGLEIITEGRGYRPSIFTDLDFVINDFFNNSLAKDKKLLNHFIEFFAYYIQIPQEVDEFENLEAYHEHRMDMDYETLSSKSDVHTYINNQTNDMRSLKQTFKSEVVKSFEELMIANFLYMNGVEYEYEKKYSYNVGDQKRKQYEPDFYLPEYDIYLEHFGTDEFNRTPQYSKHDEQEYLEGMDWKRQVHKDNGTKLLESYSYWNKNGELIDKVSSLLQKNGVQFKERDSKEVFESVFNFKENRYLDEFKNLIKSFIRLFKSKGYKSSDFKQLKSNIKEKNAFLKQRAKLFFDIIEPIYMCYQNKLDEDKAIDFNDMINEATAVINDEKVKLNYKYIIIDEYQDISMSRFNLIYSIKQKCDSKLLCVGDDWQSIYRFAGSDIALFSSFSDFVGNHSISKIEKTYRNSQSLIDIAGSFVMKNKNQIKKNLRSDKKLENPIEIITHEGDKEQALVSIVDDIVKNFGSDKSILLLGRNNFDIKCLEKSYEFKLIRKGTDIFVKSNKHPNVQINFMSVHKSKGMEADNVIIINGENDKLGFPNKISDDPVLKYVLTKPESLPYAEERRLFYVALTRTKNKTYILSNNNKKSAFVKELIKLNQIPVNTNFVKLNGSYQKCPKCFCGDLIIRENKGRQFVGCSNFPTCDYKFNDKNILSSKTKCDCGGYMIKRKSKNGYFYGCSNYPNCKNTKSIS